ncbi:hypothetical protein O3G_MSEX000218 [Manduca sexta]|nr:hypothetical protein O3G_MSEX000218 [Manduca sexta]
MADLVQQLRSNSPPLQTSAPTAAPPTAPVSNIFKMQKGRHIKKSYVDVFNPGTSAPRALPPAADVLGPAPPPPPATYFVPAPTTQVHTIALLTNQPHWKIHTPLTSG